MDTRKMASELLDSLSQLFRGPMREVRGLSGGETGMLGYLLMQGGTSAPTEISQFFHITTARVTNALNSLEKKGLVRREPVPEDRRRVTVSITAAGRAAMQERIDEIMADTARLLDALGERDAEEFLRLMKRVIELCNGAAASPAVALNLSGTPDITEKGTER